MSCSECSGPATCSKRIADSTSRMLFCEACVDGRRPVAETEPMAISTSFEKYSASFGVPRVPRQGPAVGINLFTELAKRIGQRIVQIKMRDSRRMPFKVIPLRDLMIKQHAAYYHASTYFAEWIRGVHKDAKYFARLMEDAVDAAIRIKPAFLRTLIDDDGRVRDDVMRDMINDRQDLERVTAVEPGTFREIARSGSLTPNAFQVRISTIWPTLTQAQVTAITEAWRDHVLEPLEVGLIYLQYWREGPGTYSTLFIRGLIQGFTEFGEALLTASRAPVPGQVGQVASEYNNYWQ